MKSSGRPPHRHCIDDPLTRHQRAIYPKSNFDFSKNDKFSSIFSKNRDKKYLKHFFENLSCAFFIGMILYLKRTFPGTLQVRKCGTNLFGNPNRLRKCEFPSRTPYHHRRSNGALMRRQWTVDTMSMQRATRATQNTQELFLTPNSREDIVPPS